MFLSLCKLWQTTAVYGEQTCSVLYDGKEEIKTTLIHSKRLIKHTYTHTQTLLINNNHKSFVYILY